jgi:hypothetical protein
LRYKILTWGATETEVHMALIGDDLAPAISATRAITINAPISKVWQWMIQLGADRGGFFSYALLEKALGYEMRSADPRPEFTDIEVGRIIPASLDESKSVIKFSFPVVAIDPGKAFVLENWGAFVLKEITPTQTRLIVRTHGRASKNLLDKLDEFVGVVPHYIMERRMLLGLQAQVVSGAPLASTADNLWLLGLVLSGLGVALLVFTGGGLQGIILSLVFGILWLCTLLIFDPRPIYSLGLSLAILTTMLIFQ